MAFRIRITQIKGGLTGCRFTGRKTSFLPPAPARRMVTTPDTTRIITTTVQNGVMIARLDAPGEKVRGIFSPVIIFSPVMSFY